jgi:hypothetical protein
VLGSVKGELELRRGGLSSSGSSGSDEPFGVAVLLQHRPGDKVSHAAKYQFVVDVVGGELLAHEVSDTRLARSIISSWLRSPLSPMVTSL